MKFNIITIMAFYVILVSLAIMLASEVSVRFIRGSRIVGASVGGVIGVLLCILLWVYVGKRMVTYRF